MISTGAGILLTIQSQPIQSSTPVPPHLAWILGIQLSHVWDIKKAQIKGHWPVSFRKVPLSSRHDGQDKRCVGIAERISHDVPGPVFSCVTWPAHQKLVLHFFLVGVPRSQKKKGPETRQPESWGIN